MNVGPSVIIKLRAEYRRAWGREWPHDNQYLKTIWVEARAAKINLADRYEYALEAMREDD